MPWPRLRNVGPMATAPRKAAPRSLADDLRSRPDADLVALLRARPDLAVPRPTELGTVAARAAGRASVQRAVDSLDRATLQVLEVAAVYDDPVPAGTVSQRWGADARGPLERLRALGLLWGGTRALHVVRAAREALGPYPAGLGPPLHEALTRRSPQRLEELATDLGLQPGGDPETTLTRLAAHLGDPGNVRALLERAPDGARAVLDRLTWGPPVGQLADADRPVRSATASSPVEWLLAHALLAVSDPGHVVLPREVGLALRGGRVHASPAAAPPELTGTTVSARLVESAAVGAAAELVRHVEDLGRLWGADPPAVLRAGGLGVRELRRAAQQLGLDEATAATVVELAFQAGLVADDGEADARWAPTPAFDTWRARSVGDRWEQLATAWLGSNRAAWLVGTRDARDAVRNPLGRDLERAGLAELKRQVLTDLVSADPASSDPAPAAPSRQQDPARRLAPSGQSVIDRLDWHAPRLAGSARHDAVRALLQEAAALGVTGAGAICAAGRALAGLSESGEPGNPGTSPGAVLDAALPAPVDHVLIQADLTAVAPGPLEPGFGDELGLLADVESRGAATVYRFSPASIRRAFDAGRTSADVLALLEERSTTGVPQPLRYLVEDVAQRHARIRVGSASSFVRAEDPAILSELMADRRTAGLGLRRLAPTVLATQAPAEEVLRVLRELGLAPAAETATGELLLGGGDRPHRTPPRPAPQPRGPAQTPSEDALAGLVRSLRAADRAGGEGEGTGRGTDGAPRAPFMRPTPPSVSLARVRSAAERRASVWIAYVDGEGRTAHRLVEPLVVDEGRLSARDVRSSDVTVVPVHRIIAVSAGDEGS